MTKVVLYVMLSCICFAQPNQSQRIELTVEGKKWAEETLRNLSLEEKIGQMLQVRYFADYPSFNSAEYKALRDELRKYNIGSVVLGLHFDASGPMRNSPLAQATVANQLQRDSKLPLLIAADLERGVASPLTDVPSFPWPMAFGAIGDPNNVERFGAITARESRAVGIHWALAPVADVNNNPANPIINTRAFGDDPEQVGSLVAAFIRGAHEYGMLVSAKHFPGQGDTAVDSHHGLPMIAGSLEHLQSIEFLPFKRAIDARADSILLAHARVPILEPDPGKISTVSFNIVSSILKGQLGFKGVVITDAMEMSAVSSLYGRRAALEAVKAGCDVIALPINVDGAFRAILEAVQRGEISQARIDESVRKILQLKASVGLNQSRFVDLEEVSKLAGRPDDLDFAQHISDDAVTLVRDNRKMLPLRASEITLPNHATIQPQPRGKHGIAAILITESLASNSGHDFERALKARRADTAVFYADDEVAEKVSQEILKAVNEADKVIVAAYVYHTAARQTMREGKLVNLFGLPGPSGRLLRRVLAIAPEKTVVVAIGSPYIIENFPEIQTYICTYAPVPTSEIAAVKALFGEIQGHGKLPVTLPNTASRGFSLPWPTRPLTSGK
jgi:beta-N-acetylhexosaminidase